MEAIELLIIIYTKILNENSSCACTIYKPGLNWSINHINNLELI